MNVVLIGMKHCGKSTVGVALAERWGCAFHDVDRMIEATHACAGEREQSVREMFREHGEDHFRQIEGQVVCDLYLNLNRPGNAGVVALGGRTATNRSVADLLGGIGLVVFLDPDPSELWARVERGGLPPFVEGEDPAAAFAALCAERRPQYERIADLVVKLDRLGVDEALEKLVRSIEEHADAR